MGENIRTYEELLIDRVNRTLMALDNESITQFDRIMENTEIMLTLKGPLYKIYNDWKVYYQHKLLAGYDEITKRANTMSDKYSKEIYQKHNEAILEWSFRIDLLQKLVGLLNDYQLVPFGTPEYAEAQTEEVPVELPQEEELQPQEEPEPQDLEPMEELPPVVQQPRRPIPMRNQPPQRQQQVPGVPQDQLSRLQREEQELLQMQQQQQNQQNRPPPQKRFFKRE